MTRQEIFERDGFISIVSQTPNLVGRLMGGVLDMADTPFGHREAIPAMVIGFSTREEWRKQCIEMGGFPIEYPGDIYYRVVAE